MPITAGELALIETHETQTEWELWLGPARGVLDESTVVSPWLPTTLAGWVNHTADVLQDPGVTITYEGRGQSIEFSISEESRLTWADDLAVAVVAKHWNGSSWTSRALAGWGYLDGTGRQRLGIPLDQTGSRKVTYTGYWGRTNVPPHRIGRVNLANGASIGGSTPPLANVDIEAPLEYVSQDDNAAAKAIDGIADTVYIGDIIADPVQPTIGTAADVRINRVYNGHQGSRLTGAGDESIWIELTYLHRVATWGDMTNAGAVPHLEGHSGNTRNDSQITSSITTSGPIGAYYQIQSKTGQSNPLVRNGVQWNLSFGLPKRSAKLVLTYKAASPGSIGRRINLTFKPLDPGATSENISLSLAQDWQIDEFDMDNMTNYGGVVLRIQNEAGEVASQDLYFAFRFEIWIGYTDLNFGQPKLHLSYDNGAGVVNTRRIAWDIANGEEDWRIPPRGTVIITDDEKLFRDKFDPGNIQVFQLRNLEPEWFFASGVGKVALRRGNTFSFGQYAPPGYTTVDEINFAGWGWLDHQGVSRQSPVGTGSFVVEDYPHVGLLPGSYGGGFLWVDLGDYVSTTLQAPLTASTSNTSMTVEDGDRIVVGSQHIIGVEKIFVSSRNNNTFTILRAQAGTTVAAHNPGDEVTPILAGATQTGPMWDLVTIRRKLGTPALKSGVILRSNLPSPGDPSVGGSKWALHPDWDLVTAFNNPTASSTLTITVPGGPVQARHVCVGDVLMHRHLGEAQRFKINEITVREYLYGSSSVSGWVGHGANNLAEAAAHMLTQHGGVPTNKISISVNPAPMGDIAIAGATLDQILGNLEADGLFMVVADVYNFVTISPHPASTQYNSSLPYVTLTVDHVLREPEGEWGVRNPVAQIRGTFTDSINLRTYYIVYPDVAGTLGEIVEIKGTVRSWSEGRDRCIKEFRSRNVRRTPVSRVIGPAPWVRVNMRIVDNFPELDSGGQWTGVNCVVDGYTVKLPPGPSGGSIAETELSLREIVL